MVRSTWPVRGGLQMYLLEADKTICKALAKQGQWERDVADAVERYARPDWTFLDLGAHVGFFSLLASRLYGHVIAVEPVPMFYALLERNLELNDIQNVELHKVAVTDTDGSVQMFVVDKGNVGMSWVSPRPKEDTVAVPSLRLDSILAGRRPEVIKIDIEGCEYRALAGSEALGSARVIISEYCTSQLERSSRCSGRQYHDLLTDAGFEVCDMQERPLPFERLPTGGYTNVLALRKGEIEWRTST